MLLLPRTVVQCLVGELKHVEQPKKKKIVYVVCGIYPFIKCEVLIQIYIFFQMVTQLSQ